MECIAALGFCNTVISVRIMFCRLITFAFYCLKMNNATLLCLFCIAECLLNLIKILIEKRDMRYFSKVASEYYSLYDTSRGILRVEAVTAIPLTDSQRDAMTKKLSSSLNKTVILTNAVDKSTLGGVKIRYSGVQLDGSVKTRLDKFESALKNSVI